MRAFYFPELPLHAVQTHLMVVHPNVCPGALNENKRVNQTRTNWEREYGTNIMKSLRGLGQLNPCIVSWWKDHHQWLIEPGQTRWFAMRDLGWTHFRVLLQVMPGQGNPFAAYPHEEFFRMEQVFALYTSDGKVKNKNTPQWFKQNKWLLSGDGFVTSLGSRRRSSCQ